MVSKGDLYVGTVERIQFLVDRGVCEYIDNSQLDVMLLSKYAKHTGGPNFITSDGKNLLVRQNIRLYKRKYII